MAEIKTAYELAPLLLPIDKYNFCVKVWRSTDGNAYAFAGDVKYFETEGQAQAFIEAQQRQTVSQ